MCVACSEARILNEFIIALFHRTGFTTVQLRIDWPATECMMYSNIYVVFLRSVIFLNKYQPPGVLMQTIENTTKTLTHCIYTFQCQCNVHLPEGESLHFLVNKGHGN